MSSSEDQRSANPVSGDRGPGTDFKDIVPIPGDTQPVTDPHNEETTASLAQKPTLSHELAMDDHEVKGYVQQDHEKEVRNLGWNEEKEHIAKPLVGGMDNEDLWMLIRRFNKVRARPIHISS